jgi:hypothetical protein
MLTKEWTGITAAPESRKARLLAAAALHGASLALGRLASHLAQAVRRPAGLPPVLEFYADSSAPEGALYVDGKLVGHLPGVMRL